MRHVIERSARFDAHTEATLTEVVERKGALANLYAFAPAAPPDAAAVATAVDEAMNHPASPYDSHPSPADRIRMAQRLAAPGRPRDGDEAPVWELFANREEIEVAMTDVVRQDVAEAHGVSIARAE
jgi:hypothetical protein